MPVNVISTIKPKNQGTFPVVEAVDVKVTDEQRLDAALASKASQADVTELQTAVAGKASQSELDTLSLAVAGKASTADLATTNVAVALKANASDVSTATANLQSQIDALVTPVTQDAEVQNARTGADGTSYTTLKERLDTENISLNNSISDVESVVGIQRCKIDSTTLVPFSVPTGASITIYTEDGANFPENQFKLYDEEETYIDYFSLNSTFGNSRTVTNIKSSAAYVALNTNSARKICAIRTELPNLASTVAENDAICKDLEPRVESIENVMENGGYMYSSWARVGYSRNPGGARPSITASTKRVSFVNLLFVKANTKIHIESASGQKYARAAWTYNNGVYTNTLWGDWETASIDWIIPVDSYIAVICAKSDADETFTLDELEISVYVFDTIIANHELRIEDLEGDIAERFKTEMAATITSVRNCMTEPCIVFPKLTDIHYAPNSAVFQNFDETIKNIKYLTKSIHVDFVANLGDNINGSSNQSLMIEYADYMGEQFNSLGVPYIFCLGNHDTNYDPSPKFSIEQIFRAFYTLTSKDAVLNMSSNGTDFYIDYNNIGVRIVSLNTQYLNAYYISDDSAAWFAEEALNTDKLVLLLDHMSPIYSQNYAGTDPYNGQWITGKIEDFIENGGTLIQLFGHSHADFAFTTPWLSIASDCAKFEKADLTAAGYAAITGYTGTIEAPDRTLGTASEQAWDVVVLRPTSRKINLIRFGAGNDREFTY